MPKSRTRVLLPLMGALALTSLTGVAYVSYAQQAPQQAPTKSPQPPTRSVALTAQESEWIKRLGSDDPEEVRKAIDEIAPNRKTVHTAVLARIAALRYGKGDPAIQQQVEAAFPNLHNDMMVQRLREMFASSDPAQRRAALFQLVFVNGRIMTPQGPVQQKPDKDTVELVRSLLESALADPAPEVRKAAVQPILYQENPGRNALLVKGLESTDPVVRSETLSVLTQMVQGTGSSGTPYWHLSKPEALAGQTSLLPGLMQVVQNGKEGEVTQAAVLIAAIGPEARTALLTLCTALVSKEDRGDFVFRRDVAWSIQKVCGGPENTAPQIATLLKDKDATTRRVGAAALGHQYDFLSSRVEKQPDGRYLPPLEDRTLIKGFQQAAPDLAAVLNDSDGAVRLAATKSLDALSANTMSANAASVPWEKTLKPLAAQLAEKDPALRIAAARTLALVPASLLPVLPELRRALTREPADPKFQAYLTVAFSHLVQLDRAATQSAFLSDLGSVDVAKRRLTAQEMETVGPLLWGNSFWSQDLSVLNYWNDNQLSSWHTPDGQLSRVDLQVDRTPLVAGLEKALGDSDRELRLSTARTIEQISKAVYRMLGHGGIVRADKGEELIKPLIEKARDAVKADDPALAKRLDTLRTQYDGPRVVL